MPVEALGYELLNAAGKSDILRATNIFYNKAQDCNCLWIADDRFYNGSCDEVEPIGKCSRPEMTLYQLLKFPSFYVRVLDTEHGRQQRISAPIYGEKEGIFAEVQAGTGDDQTGKSGTVIVTNNHPALQKPEVERCTMMDVTDNHPTVAMMMKWAQYADSATEYTHWLPLSRKARLMDTSASKKYAEDAEQAPRSIPPLLAGNLHPSLLQSSAFSDFSSVVQEMQSMSSTRDKIKVVTKPIVPVTDNRQNKLRERSATEINSAWCPLCGTLSESQETEVFLGSSKYCLMSKIYPDPDIYTERKAGGTADDMSKEETEVTDELGRPKAAAQNEMSALLEVSLLLAECSRRIYERGTWQTRVFYELGSVYSVSAEKKTGATYQLKQYQRPPHRSSRAKTSMAVSEVVLEACAQLPVADNSTICILQALLCSTKVQRHIAGLLVQKELGGKNKQNETGFWKFKLNHF
ncbi:hypothetical protein U0070_019173 [Myodes glareolus]|uniref:Uncharacterized protein n=1 Tax=Myodes glareolus TaxID=447135 RepID=A0AAW0ILB2_MYOGA